MNGIITLRPARTDDHEFLHRVYASTRVDELAPVPWPPETKAAFLRSQFELQHRAYHENMPAAAYDIIVVDGTDAGRLYVGRFAREMRIIDIALLPDYRGCGIGTSLIRTILAEATRAQLPIRIHVEQFNRALNLYDRLGFVRTGETGPYYEMEWRPPAAPPP